MGPKISHMNIFAMSSIVHSVCDDVVMIMRHIRNPLLSPQAMRYELMIARRTIIVREAENAGLLTDINEEEEDYLQMMVRLRNAPPPPRPESPQEAEELKEEEQEVAIIEEPIILQNPEMKFEAFQTVLELFEVHESDMDILYSLFRLTDKRGIKIADVTDVLMAFCVVTSKNARECIMTALRIYNIAHAPTVPETINRIGLVHILMQLNSACFYFGDRVMDEKFVWDLSDSVISSALPAQDHDNNSTVRAVDDSIAVAERINKDGPVAHVSLTDSTEEEIDRLFIPYQEYIDLIVEHPVVEMMLSVQYQGTVKNKMTAQEGI